MKDMKKADRAILAHGETTGHFHEAVGDGVALWEDNGTAILDAPHGATVQHQEHAPVTLPAGKYERSIVREYDHFAEESRSVVD